MPEPASPEVEAELQRLRDMAEQLRAALAVLKKQIDASSPPTAEGMGQLDATGGERPDVRGA